MDKKTLIQFYNICQEKGYTDMSDDGQLLDAKVVAADLGLRNKDIDRLHQQAEKAYLEEKYTVEKNAVVGDLLFSVQGNFHKLEIYRRPDESLYSILDTGNKMESAPEIKAKKSVAVNYTYNPSKAIFTSSTVGGITTGGIHYTKASYTPHAGRSDKGEIQISIAGTSFIADSVTFSTLVWEQLQRDPYFRRLTDGKRTISCRSSDNFYRTQAGSMLKNADLVTNINLVSKIAEEERLTYDQCQEIVSLLYSIIRHDLSPALLSDDEMLNRAVSLLESKNSDLKEQAEKILLSILDYTDATDLIHEDAEDLIYKRAVELSNAESSSELKHAIELFDTVPNYKDAKTQVNNLNNKLELVRHEEKKKAILLKEARIIKAKKFAAIFLAALMAVIAIALLITKVILPHI